MVEIEFDFVIKAELNNTFGKVFQRLIKQLQNKFKRKYFSNNDKK